MRIRERMRFPTVLRCVPFVEILVGHWTDEVVEWNGFTRATPTEDDERFGQKSVPSLVVFLHGEIEAEPAQYHNPLILNKLLPT